MYSWKNNRNYKQIKDKDGHKQYFITVDDTDYEVNGMLYRMYSAFDRRERYLLEEQKTGRELSLDQLIVDGVPITSLVYEQIKSTEDTMIHKLNMLELYEAIQALDQAEQLLIYQYYAENKSMRTLAAHYSVSAATVCRRISKVLDKLRFWYGLKKR